MVALMSLWLPILLSAVIVFAASSVMHIVLTYHRKDFSQLPNEDRVADALRGTAPGMYMLPWSASMKDMNTPAMVEKFKRGPIGMVMLRLPGPPGFGKNLVQWFVFSIVVGVFVAYVCGHTIPPGAPYLPVFRVAGTVAFLGYVGAEATKTIWGGQPWGTTVKNYIDGLVYALLTAGVFGWLWPKV